MRRIPFSQQTLPPDYLTAVKADVQSGKPVSGDDLLRAIEQCVSKPLAEDLRDVVRRSKISGVKRRGRPLRFRAVLDFALEEVDQEYPNLLRKYQDEARQQKAAARAAGAKLPKIDHSPCERAYRRILTTMKKDFGNIDWKALRNLHIRWKKGCFHRAENPGDGPEDVEDEIDRLFPSVKPRSTDYFPQ